MVETFLKRYSFPGKPHSFMGFHDTSGIDPSTSRMIQLGVDFIDRPPIAGDRASIGITDWESGETEVVCETDGWNFPQGTRQHFVREGSAISYNRSEERQWIGVIRDLKTRSETLLEKPLYAVGPDGTVGYGLNFARLHRLGGYGYIGLRDDTEGESAPYNDGLWSVSLETGNARLLVSIADAVENFEGVPSECSHYFTHIVLSPSGSYISFLHRYWLPDGGIQTRLMVCDADGSRLQCWAEGYLSHFDWWDEGTILIWGRPPSRLQQARNHPAMRFPLVSEVVRLLKPAIRRVMQKPAGTGWGYLLVNEGGYTGLKFAPEFLAEDGHPSFRPPARDWLLTDTYPNLEGERRLMLVRRENPLLQELLRLTEYRIPVNYDRIEDAMCGIDETVKTSFRTQRFAHTRSGIHCDFHPRWRRDGLAVCFDSNHEGFRAVYSVDVSEWVGDG